MSAHADLILTPAGLALRTPDGLLVGAAVERLEKPRPGRDLLRRAVADAHGAELVDATAGLGADSFHLAASGLRVTMVERVPQVAQLLRDALQRAAAGQLGPQAQLAAANLTLVEGDARELLRSLRQQGRPPAVVLLDPMYPRRGKSALPGKGMALFRDLVGDDADAAQLLQAALTSATRRVVVKRPAKAPPLGGLSPSGSLRGSTTRYDLYAPRKLG